MEYESILFAILLGIVEGLTEFLPVSSTGHLILLIDLLSFKAPEGKVFEIIIQFGAILAVVWLYRVRLFGAVFGAVSQAKDRRFLLNILLAILPSMVLGVIFHDVIKTVLFNPTVVATTMILGGFIILLIERMKPTVRYETVDAFDWKLALKIGFCQAVAMIPGTSRSGATIMGALVLGVERKTAAEFSFFLAVPTMLAATVYDIYKNYHQLDMRDAELILVGFVVSFISALFVVKHLIGFISRHGFAPFAYYRIALGALMLVLILG